MFELNITCSKDISELKINFTDGTCSTIGKEDERSELNGRTTCDGVTPKNVEQKSDDGSTITTSDVANDRKNLSEYLDFDDVEEMTSFEPLAPPTIEKRERSVNVTEEARSGNY